MAIVFADRVFSMTMQETLLYYTDPGLDALIGSAERFCAQARTTNLAGGTQFSVVLETSEDGLTWATPSGTVKFMDKVTASEGGSFFGFANPTSVLGRYARLNVSSTLKSCRIDVWLVGRDAL